MKDICRNCHTQELVENVYEQGAKVVEATNEKVEAVQKIMGSLHSEGLLGELYSQPIDFKYFDLWHYYGRTAKHGAFMGGADFVQWHGNYPILEHAVEIRAMAEELRRTHATTQPQARR